MTDVTARAVAVRCRLGGIPRAADALPGLAHRALRDEAILIRVGSCGRPATVRH